MDRAVAGWFEGPVWMTLACRDTHHTEFGVFDHPTPKIFEVSKAPSGRSRTGLIAPHRSRTKPNRVDKCICSHEHDEQGTPAEYPDRWDLAAVPVLLVAKLVCVSPDRVGAG
jgi:hypothetical protein